jgi:hypothetical protein
VTVELYFGELIRNGHMHQLDAEAGIPHFKNRKKARSPLAAQSDLSEGRSFASYMRKVAHSDPDILFWLIGKNTPTIKNTI